MKISLSRPKVLHTTYIVKEVILRTYSTKVEESRRFLLVEKDVVEGRAFEGE
jgi:hypothetical protein